MVSGKNFDDFEWKSNFDALFEGGVVELIDLWFDVRVWCVREVRRKEFVHRNSTKTRRTRNGSQLGPISKKSILEQIWGGTTTCCHKVSLVAVRLAPKVQSFLKGGPFGFKLVPPAWGGSLRKRSYEQMKMTRNGPHYGPHFAWTKVKQILNTFKQIPNPL